MGLPITVNVPPLLFLSLFIFRCSSRQDVISAAKQSRCCQSHYYINAETDEKRSLRWIHDMQASKILPNTVIYFVLLSSPPILPTATVAAAGAGLPLYTDRTNSLGGDQQTIIVVHSSSRLFIRLLVFYTISLF